MIQQTKGFKNLLFTLFFLRNQKPPFQLSDTYYLVGKHWQMKAMIDSVSVMLS